MTERGVIDLSLVPTSASFAVRCGSGEPAMYEGKLVFAQLMDHLPLHTFRRCVARFKGDHRVTSSPARTSCGAWLLPS